MRWLVIAIVLIIFGSAAWAQNSMIFQPPIGPSSQVPIGPFSSQGGGASVTCGNKLDFSQACNSQYLPVIGLI